MWLLSAIIMCVWRLETGARWGLGWVFGGWNGVSGVWLALAEGANVALMVGLVLSSYMVGVKREVALLWRFCHL